jgi:hypothetical protein
VTVYWGANPETAKLATCSNHIMRKQSTTMGEYTPEFSENVQYTSNRVK